MYIEDLKKRLLNSRDVFTAKRWEGKPWSFKFKFAYANYPEFLISGFLFVIVGPLICYYKYVSYPGSRKEAIRKYKSKYTVVRDDHPNIEKIILEKESGRHFFPK